MWTAKILTLFPKLFPGPLGSSVIGQALADEKWALEAYDIRNFSIDKHRTVDEPGYGGGGGMVLRPDVIGNAIETVLDSAQNLIYLSPRGEKFSQAMAEDFINCSGINLICGRFEGLDQRAIDEYNMREVSIGDYILSSGDIAAFVLLDVCVRLLPGVLGSEKSLHEESFSVYQDQRLLEYPHYTRPQVWKGREVPAVLLSGHHSNIKKWRKEQALKITRERRPDLLDNL